MGDSTPMRGRRLKVVSPQKRRAPDAMPHTRNVAMAVARPVPFRQSRDAPVSASRRRILRAQSHRNNPALLFPGTPLRTLYDPLKSSLEVKRTGRWRAKNPSARRATFGKTDSPGAERASASQNFCPLKRSSRREKNRALRFPNTVPARPEPSADDGDLRRASSRSIKLSRKCDLSRMRESRTEREDAFALLPRMETPIDSVACKPVASSPGQSFYDIVDTASTASTPSLSSLGVENKKTSANVAYRARSIPDTASHLRPRYSEYEINVLHYDGPPESSSPQLARSHFKSTNTSWSSAYNCSSAKVQNDNDDLADKAESGMESRTWDEGKTVDDVKYSWEADNWLPPSRRKELDDAREIKSARTNGKSPYECKIKYSWQVVGTGTQTSYTLLHDLLNDVEDSKSAYKTCSVKYSWQIIGIGAQASLHDCNDSDYWSGVLLTPSKNCGGNEAGVGNDETRRAKPHDYARCVGERLKRCLILNNQQTQTFAEKEIQVDPNMEQILEEPTGQKLPGKLELEQIDNCDESLHKYAAKPLTPNISSKSSVISDNGNEKTKREELLTRLTCAVKKLNQYDRDMAKTRSADAPRPDAEGTFAQRGEALPRGVEDNIKGIVESTREYIAKLDCQLKDLDEADRQIENSVMRTLKDIDGTFQSLLDDVYDEINKRREQLILETEVHKHESLIPLRACRKEVQAQMQNARNIISMSDDILRHPHRYSANGLGKIISASNDIGRIPAVPYSEELPNINFDRQLSSCKEEIVEQISKLGCISRTVPVQIINIEERPAGLFVKWHVTNPEYFEEQTFVVERANGEILDPASSKFETVYRGSETSCFIRNVPVDRPVTLRVRIQADNVARSVHHFARTSVPPYSWELDNKDYVVTNNGKSAAKVTDAVSTLFSRGPQFDANHIIEFKFLEVSQEGNDDEGIALVYDPQGSHDALKRAASLMITPEGRIFMDGDEKLMRLPRMRFGAVIVISAFRKNAHVLRVNVESDNKCVTYDWRVRTPLYLAARFAERKKWHLTIE